MYIEFHRLRVKETFKNDKNCEIVVGDGGRGSMLPDSGQSKWTAILAGDQGSVCLHTA